MPQKPFTFWNESALVALTRELAPTSLQLDATPVRAELATDERLPLVQTMPLSFEQPLKALTSIPVWPLPT